MGASGLEEKEEGEREKDLANFHTRKRRKKRRTREKLLKKTSVVGKRFLLF